MKKLKTCLSNTHAGFSCDACDIIGKTEDTLKTYVTGSIRNCGKRTQNKFRWNGRQGSKKTS